MSNRSVSRAHRQGIPIFPHLGFSRVKSTRDTNNHSGSQGQVVPEPRDSNYHFFFLELQAEPACLLLWEQP
jgi:hypothetical protein